MNPVVERLLKKAEKLHANAVLGLKVGLYEDAGRNSYLAGYAAARAFLYQQEGKVFKSHKGLLSVFSLVTKDDPRFAPEMRGFLSNAYNLKRIADYDDGPDAGISKERAAIAVEQGKQFIKCCEHAIAVPQNGKHKKPTPKPHR